MSFSLNEELFANYYYWVTGCLQLKFKLIKCTVHKCGQMDELSAAIVQNTVFILLPILL